APPPTRDSGAPGDAYRDPVEEEIAQPARAVGGDAYAEVRVAELRRRPGSPPRVRRSAQDGRVLLRRLLAVRLRGRERAAGISRQLDAHAARAEGAAEPPIEPDLDPLHRAPGRDRDAVVEEPVPVTRAVGVGGDSAAVGEGVRRVSFEAVVVAARVRRLRG